jgi:hypothetical protein
MLDYRLDVMSRYHREICLNNCSIFMYKLEQTSWFVEAVVNCSHVYRQLVVCINCV